MVFFWWASRMLRFGGASCVCTLFIKSKFDRICFRRLLDSITCSEPKPTDNWIYILSQWYVHYIIHGMYKYSIPYSGCDSRSNECTIALNRVGVALTASQTNIYIWFRGALWRMWLEIDVCLVFSCVGCSDYIVWVIRLWRKCNRQCV